MKARVLADTPFRDPTIYWATGFLAPDPFLYIETKDGKWLIASELEYTRAKNQTKPDVEVLLLSKPSYLEELLLLLRRLRITEMVVPQTFPAFFWAGIARKGYRLTIEKDPFPERALKTDGEVKNIRDVQRAIEAVFDLAITRLANATVRDGIVYEGNTPLASDELRSFMDLEFYGRGFTNPLGIIIASGEQAVEPHNLGFGPIRANVPIVFDIFPRSRWTLYWSDMTRTVTKGKLSEEAKRLYCFVKDAQELGLSMVRDGAHGKKIHSAVEQFFERNGKYRTNAKPGNVFGFIHGTGHGVGLDMHEAPRISRVGDELKAGHVITIEPGLYYPGLGGVRIEDTILVTKDGYENLALTPKDLLEL